MKYILYSNVSIAYYLVEAIKDKVGKSE